MFVLHFFLIFLNQFHINFYSHACIIVWKMKKNEKIERTFSLIMYGKVEGVPEGCLQVCIKNSNVFFLV